MIRVNIPALSGERRTTLIGTVKQIGEQATVAVRNVRRDANKHIDQAAQDKTSAIREDDVTSAHDAVQELLKTHEHNIDHAIVLKQTEFQEMSSRPQKSAILS